MPEHVTTPAAPPTRRGGFSRVREHPFIAAAVAIVSFLGLGSILGNWLVDRGAEVVRGPTQPAGFSEIYAEWRQAQEVSDELLSTSESLTSKMERGTGYAGINLAPEVVRDDLQGLNRVARDASALEGRVEAAKTDLIGPQGDLIRLATVIRRMARLVEQEFWSVYRRSNGEAWTYGSGGFGPLFSNRIADTAVTQNDQVRQIDAALRPLAVRFEKPAVEISGWMRIPFPGSHSDVP